MKCQISDSDESCDLFELYVGDGTLAQHTGFSEEEYNQLFDEVHHGSPGARRSQMPWQQWMEHEQ